MDKNYTNTATKTKSLLTSPTLAQLPAVAVLSGHIVYMIFRVKVEVRPNVQTFPCRNSFSLGNQGARPHLSALFDQKG
jgi:hypothetical protein